MTRDYPDDNPSGQGTSFSVCRPLPTTAFDGQLDCPPYPL